MKKTFKKHDKNLTSTSTNYIPTLDKFSLKAFNWLSYKHKVSGPLFASYLFDLPDHYSPKAIVKLININLLKIKFLLILNDKNFNQSNNIVCVNGAKVRMYFIYKHYAHCGLHSKN